VIRLIKKEIQRGISSEFIFIGGFSQGGSVALYTVQNKAFSHYNEKN
jgi:predicted esterase